MQKKLCLAIALAVAVGCAAKTPPAPPRLPPGSAEDATDVRVTLAWSESVDLDLYVTDPAQETVYFANSSTGTGGKLERDVTCSGVAASKPGGMLSESIRWERPPSGRYRVGVDFMDGCGSSADEVTFRVAVDVGGSRKERVGKIAKSRFEPLIIEFDVPSGVDESRAAR